MAKWFFRYQRFNYLFQSRSLFKKKRQRKKEAELLEAKMWQRSHKCSSLELRLGPPGEESLNENMKNVNKERDGSESPLTLGYFSTQKISTSHTPGPRGDAVFHHQHNPHQANAKASSFPQHQSSPQNMAVMGKDESQSQPCCVDLQDAEKNAFSPSSALPNRSHKRYSCFSLLYICIF